MKISGIFRATNVLVHYRGFSLPEGVKFRAYVERLVSHPTFKKTCSTEDLYLDSYERSVAPVEISKASTHAYIVTRYAYNRPNTSQVANAINSGRALP